MPFKKPSAFSKPDLRRGFEVLDQLWSRNLFPEDLERHYFLHWFVVYQGNIVRTAEEIQLHRNTLQGYFLKFGFSSQSVRLRHSWQRSEKKNKRSSFESKFLNFYQRFGGKPKFTLDENKRLTALWKTGFPLKTLTTHYALWAVKKRQSRDWVSEKLGFSNRHSLRLLTSTLNPKSRDGFWLAPLKPTREIVYARRHLKNLSKTKGR
jgi:hypothetical protein